MPDHTQRVVITYLDNSGKNRCDGLASSISGLKSNRICVAHALTTSFTSSEHTSARTDPHRGMVKKWNAINQGSIRRLIRSMRRRCQESIQARDGHTSNRAVVFIIRAVLNILDNIHDMVTTVSTLSFTLWCTFVHMAFLRTSSSCASPQLTLSVLGTRIRVVSLYIVT